MMIYVDNAETLFKFEEHMGELAHVELSKE